MAAEGTGLYKSIVDLETSTGWQSEILPTAFTSYFTRSGTYKELPETTLTIMSIIYLYNCHCVADYDHM